VRDIRKFERTFNSVGPVTILTPHRERRKVNKQTFRSSADYDIAKSGSLVRLHTLCVKRQDYDSSRIRESTRS
jgi:hypothetical protein